MHLVDVKKMFEQYSPHAIVGKETILEHVHPNLYGYAIMSDAFFRAFQQQHLISDTPQKTISFDELRKEMPLTQMDSLSGLYQIMFLKRGWPFNQPLPASFMLKNTLDDTLAVQVALGHMQWKDAFGYMFERASQTGDKAKQCVLAEAMALEYPQSQDFCGLAATLNEQLGHFDMAALYYCALNHIHADGRFAARAIKMYLRGKNVDAAISAVSELPSNQQDEVRSILTGIQADEKILQAAPADKNATQRLSDAFKKLGIADSLLKPDKKLKQKT